MIKKLWSAISSKPTESLPPFNMPVKPKQSIYAIGDIHGCIKLLRKILSKVPEGSKLVFLGDLIDRGKNSALVLERVKQECDNGAICLMGNHERMLLDFLDNPVEKGRRWMRHGGLQTLASFGVRRLNERPTEAELLLAHEDLKAKLTPATIEWMRALPLQWHSGNVHFVHAAARPHVPMNEQGDRTLLWGSEKFFQQPRQDGQWVVHGHTIVEEANAEAGRINIDTGAYATGNLSAVKIDKNGFEFELVSRPKQKRG